MKAAWLSGTTIISADNGCEPPSAKVVIPKAAHAVHVRPVGERYQLLAGHHRIRSARAKGLSHVWAWVEPMEDERVFMELATSNNQGELAPLEIGIHALKAVPKAQGKKNAGLAAYAYLVGKSKQTISELRQAAEVALTCTAERTSLLDKAKHLTAIHSADRRVWPECVETMLKAEWTAKDTEHWVGKVRDICQTIDGIGQEWESVFLDRVPVVKRFLATKEFSARTVAALGAKAASIAASVRETLRENPEPTIEAFKAWLRENVGGKSWDVRHWKGTSGSCWRRYANRMTIGI